MKHRRVDGDYLGDCGCGCGFQLFERLYLRPSGTVAFRTRPKFARHHSLRVNHCDRTGAPHYPVAEARKAMLLPLGAELDATIHRRRRELGLSTAQMHDLLGWKGANNLHRYKFVPRLMPSTLHRVLDRLFADEGGWVEAGPVWSLARQRQALWGMTDEELAAHLGTTEVRWIGKETARRILLALSGPRQPSSRESDETRRARDRAARARCPSRASQTQDDDQVPEGGPPAQPATARPVGNRDAKTGASGFGGLGTVRPAAFPGLPLGACLGSPSPKVSMPSSTGGLVDGRLARTWIGTASWTTLT